MLPYFPQKVIDDPWLVLRVWEDISSFGGMLGGLAAAVLFFNWRVGHTRNPNSLAYVDALAFAFPFALNVGRLGCALAHDHPGRVTMFPLAVSLGTSDARAFLGRIYDAAGLLLSADASAHGFHDLGAIEFLFLATIVLPLFVYWSWRRQRVGFFLVAFVALYLPVRVSKLTIFEDC
jgi:phosphatidylglycerol---prolipoprotein diacylglyceryl transferase